MYLEGTTLNAETDSAPQAKAELLPLTFSVASKIQGRPFKKPLVVLLDSGSTTTWINKKSLLPGIQGYTVEKVTGSTLAGTFSSSKQVCLEDVSLPDFYSKQKLPKTSARVFHSEC